MKNRRTWGPRDLNEKTCTYEDRPNFRDLNKILNARRFLSGKLNPSRIFFLKVSNHSLPEWQEDATRLDSTIKVMLFAYLSNKSLSRMGPARICQMFIVNHVSVSLLRWCKIDPWCRAESKNCHQNSQQLIDNHVEDPEMKKLRIYFINIKLDTVNLSCSHMFWVGWIYSIVSTNWQIWTTFGLKL